MPITIGDLLLEELSGPVVAFIAKPKIQKIPTFLIFGETHMDIKNSCDSTQSDKYANTELKFNQIFTELNKIAETEDVHFYAESFFDPEINKIIKNTSDSMVLDKIKSKIETKGYLGLLKIVEETKRYCYYNELKKKSLSEFQSKCHFSNIKWQYSDIRHAIDDTYFQNIGIFDTTINMILNSLLTSTSIGYEAVFNKDNKKGDKIIDLIDKPEIGFYTKLWRNKNLTIKQNYDNFVNTIDESSLGLNDENETIIKKLSYDDIIECLTYYIDFDDDKFDNIINKTLNTFKIKKQLIKLITKSITKKTPKSSTKSKIKSIGYLSAKSKKTPKSSTKSKIKSIRSQFSFRKSIKTTNFVKLQLKKYLKFLKDSLFKENEKFTILYKPLFQLIIKFLKNDKDNDVFKELLKYVEDNKVRFAEDYEKIKNDKFYLYIGYFSFILDIYFLLRSFKDNTKIVSGVIGYNHVLNLISFFKLNSSIYDIYVFDNNYGDYKKYIDNGRTTITITIEKLFSNQCINFNSAYDKNDKKVEVNLQLV